jgi:type II secretory pathway component PulJ
MITPLSIQNTCSFSFQRIKSFNLQLEMQSGFLRSNGEIHYEYQYINWRMQNQSLE